VVTTQAKFYVRAGPPDGTLGETVETKLRGELFQGFAKLILVGCEFQTMKILFKNAMHPVAPARLSYMRYSRKLSGVKTPPKLREINCPLSIDTDDRE
jgi:hypothetical protein